MSVLIALFLSCLFDYFQKPQLFTTDLRGLQHVLSHSNIYQKPDAVRQSLSRIMGRGKYSVFRTWMSRGLHSVPGVLFVEGDQHKNQRRIMVCSVNYSFVCAAKPD